MRYLPFLVWCLLSAIWGSTWLFIRIGVRDLPPFTFAGMRFFAAALVLGTLLVASGRRLPRSRSDWKLVASTAVFVISVQYGLLFWAEVHIPSGLTAVLYTIMPLCGMLFAHFMVPGEPMTPIKIAGVLLGIGGVALVFRGEVSVESPLSAWACLAVLLAAASSAYAGVLIKARAYHIDALALTAVQMAIGCMPLLAVGLLREGSPLAHAWTLSAWVALLYLAMVGSALAFVLLYWLIKRMDVTQTQLIPLASTLVAVVLGRVVLGEELSGAGILGAAAILSGLAVARLGFLLAKGATT